ncbi:MAG: hypothetical protein MZV70_71870 [Desulfobacterales bacterium]|nr:hypothetical protein [Desulfobacterales bacterium]
MLVRGASRLAAAIGSLAAGHRPDGGGLRHITHRSWPSACRPALAGQRRHRRRPTWSAATSSTCSSSSGLSAAIAPLWWSTGSWCAWTCRS